MKAINLNSRPYFVTGKTVWDNGKVLEFDEYVSEPMVCPQEHRYGPEISPEEEKAQDPANKRLWSLRYPPGYPQPIGYTITFLSCTMLNAGDHEVEDARAEAHAAEQIEKMDNQ